MDERQRILQLRKELHDHNYKYYVLNQPEITDQQFDFMMHELQDLEARHPELADPNSPTQRVGSDLGHDFQQVAKYDCVDGKYLYNRCHLIGYQLTAENANPKNLITGTRYLNVDGMLEFESMVADYVKSTGNHVLYRVTPIFKDDELVARGVQMEAYSIEDNGKGVQFNVYCYNVQPNIEIDYKTGNSRYVGDESTTQYNTGERQEYIVNTSSRKFHLPSCSAVSKIKQENKKAYIGYRDNLVKNGYEPCGQCKP